MFNEEHNSQVISMEEYLCKRREIRQREEGGQKKAIEREYEKSSAIRLAELYI